MVVVRDWSEPNAFAYERAHGSRRKWCKNRWGRLKTLTKAKKTLCNPKAFERDKRKRRRELGT